MFGAELLVRRSRVPAHEDGGERDGGRHEPHVRDHERHGPVRHSDGVLQRPHYGVVAVHTDAAQVEYGHCAEVNVQRVPHVAHEVAEHPLARQLDRGVERHRAQSYQQVGQRQRDHVVVGDDAQLAVAEHADDDERVAEHGAEDDGAHDEPADQKRPQRLALEGGDLRVRRDGAVGAQNVRCERWVRGHVT